MTKLAGVMVLCGASAVGAGAFGQTPDFSGGWVAVRDVPPGVAAAPSPVFGPRFWIAQRDHTVTVTRPVRDEAMVAMHEAGGPPVRSRVPGASCLGDSGVVTQVAWRDGALVHRTVGQIAAGATAAVPGSLEHLFRRVSADMLVVESVMRVPGQAEPVRVATAYRKSADAPPAVAAPPVAVVPATLSAVAWIAGEWVSRNGSTTVEERWTPATGGAMLAMSRTIRVASMTEFEFLCIAERHGGLVYTARPNGRTPPTDFWLTAIDATSATFENPSHDFPKRIRYALRPDGGLDATISGEGGARAMTFSFVRAAGR